METVESKETDESILELKAKLDAWALDDQYELECKAQARAFLNEPFKPKNLIEAQLHEKMREYASAYLEWTPGSPHTDECGEFTSAAFDTWMHSFFDACGLPADNYHLFDFDISKPFPEEAFCRDWYSLKYLDLTVESLKELADALQEDFGEHSSCESDDGNLVTSLLAETAHEVDQSLLHKLFPSDSKKIGNRKVDKVIAGFAVSNNPLHRIFAPVLLCSSEQKKPAFLLTKDGLGEILSSNQLINRHSINHDYKKFLGFCFQKKWLKVEVEQKKGSRKAMLISIDGPIRDLVRTNLDQNVDGTIESIVSNYLSRNKQELKSELSPEATSSSPESGSESDLDLCTCAMALSNQFNDYERETIPSITSKVNRFGSFKSPAQKKIITDFLKKNNALK